MNEELAIELRCPVCLELFTWPIILPCSHILCKAPCAERLFEHGFVRCPVCRDNSFVSGGICNLPRVISLENIIEQLRRTSPPPALPTSTALQDDSEKSECLECGPDDIPCQLCESDHVKKAVKSCLHCNASYCDHCLSVSHPSRPPFNEHKLVEPRKYPKPKELRCVDHDVLVNMFCADCQTLACLFCANELGSHHKHKTLTLPQAVETFKNLVEENCAKLEQNLEKGSESLAVHRQNSSQFDQRVSSRRELINQHCDALINEIEVKRGFFLSDLEYEEKNKQELLEEQEKNLQNYNLSIENLLHYAREILKETDMCAFVQLSKSLLDKVSKSLQQISEVNSVPITLTQKVVDFRKEKAIIQDMAYLTVPNTPRINVSKCSRSTTSVVLVLCLPNNEYDVIDGYQVYYSTDCELSPDLWEKVDFKTPGESRKCSRTLPSESAICLMHNNLQPGTVYYFSVMAYNSTGSSDMSDIIQCHTLSTSQTLLHVPEIVDTQCHTYTYSIQLHSPSPLDEPTGDLVGLSHYLLFREASVNKVWKSISLYGRVDHRVFGLAPDTMYDFVIMACDKNSECQVSNMVTLKTERSAY